MGGAQEPPGPTTPLLIACALGIERLALRTGRRSAVPGPGPVSIIRSGMGPRAAESAVRHALGPDGAKDTAVIASGFCAGLEPGMHPGDLVVAEETRDFGGTT
ncbi:MAG TPA: 1-hydroxy-2-methyl-2-butenyl 4-diphosphate reductase, partial [Streptomyces sp.]|nr:1-hydroxy-2-methyl-2-butenyl 4-diphosphate reductase [Streptomyces sp.]